MHFLAISGSLRPDSSNTALLRNLSALAPDSVSVEIYDGLKSLPPFDPSLDVDPTHYEAPLPVMDLRTKLASADAVIFCTPEYAFGMPGVLKNALDWTVSMAVLERKPVAAIAASPASSGGDKAHQGLIWVLTALGTEIVDGASFTLPRIRSKMDATGKVTDEATLQTLRHALEALVRTVKARKVAP